MFAPLASLAVLAAIVTGCGSETNDTADPAVPQRIVALSTDAGIALHQLGLDDRLVAAPEALSNPTINPYAAQMAGGDITAINTEGADPEQVLAQRPDLVVVTSRHTGEKDLSAALSKTGVEVLTLTNGWSDSAAVIDNLRTIAAATGAERAAEKLVDEITTGLATLKSTTDPITNRPTVAILSNQASSPLLNGPDSLVSEVVTNGGGTNVATTLGVTRTMPVQPEQLVAAAPDYLMLIDVTGAGRASFDSLLANPAVAALPAVQAGKVKLFLAATTYGLAGREVVSAAEAVAAWLHPDLIGPATAGSTR